MKLRIAALVAVLAVACAGGVIAANVATATPTGKVTLCHLADGPAQAGLITVAAAAAYNGHYLQHTADVIPPFVFQGETYSLNWTGSFPEECGTPTDTDTGGTTTDPPPTTTDDESCPPGTHLFPPFPATDGRCVPDEQPPDDLCPNLGYVQETVPFGYELVGGLCVQPDPPKHPNKPPGTPIGDCAVQANQELLCGEQG